MLKQSSLEKCLAKPQKAVLKNIHILFSYCKALNNQQWEGRLLLSRDLQEFSWLRKRKEAKKREEKRGTEQKATMERRTEWEMTKRSRWSISHGQDHMLSSVIFQREPSSTVHFVQLLWGQLQSEIKTSTSITPNAHNASRTGACRHMFRRPEGTTDSSGVGCVALHTLFSRWVNEKVCIISFFC